MHETSVELRKRRRLSEKVAMVYVGMFVTLGEGFSTDPIDLRTRTHFLAGNDQQQANADPLDRVDAVAHGKSIIEDTKVKPQLVLDFAQRLVDNRYAHFEDDPLFAEDSADGSVDDAISGEEDHRNDDPEEKRAWGWCPSGLPESDWANQVVDKRGRSRLKRLWMLAAQAVQLVRKLPPDMQELIAGNYVEESAWLILSMAYPAQGRHGAIRRLLYLLSECL